MANAHVGLDVPIGGEVFTAGDVVSIEWTLIVPHEQENWDLYFSSDGGKNWEEIELDLPVTQFSYQWIVPDLITDEGKIKIYMDNVGGDYSAVSKNFSIRGTMVSAKDEGTVPLSFTLYPNYPNPFNPTTTIRYTLSKTDFVSLVIYDIRGEEVERLIEGEQPVGTRTVRWNASRMASGVYFYRLTAGDFVQTRKMILIR